ncbi:MAG: aminopeptidase P family protein [Bacteroidia bacterium]|nr:aminopeptidase P family protein [Bacteroidia bacterium]
MRPALHALRQALSDADLFAYIIPRTDPHQSEYPAAYWDILPWATGFTGSAGTLVVTADYAGLWTDSRYFLQAETQLAGTGVELVRLLTPHTPEFMGWIREQAPAGARIGLDDRLISMARLREMEEAWPGLTVVPVDLVTDTWQERPALPLSPVVLHDISLAGVSCTDKLSQLRAGMQSRHLDYHLMVSLEDIAWTLNLRGDDVAYTPVFVGYLLVSATDACLYADPAKLPAPVCDYLSSHGVHTAPYESLTETLRTLPADTRLGLDPAKTSGWIRRQLPEHVQVTAVPQLSTALKARKNPTEIQHLRQAMRQDGVAWIRLLRWLEARVGQEPISEVQVAEQLEAYRLTMPGYCGPSFPMICGYLGNGAIVHYRAEPETAAQLQPEGLLLIDAGGQYTYGTTDMTRTLALGPVTRAMQEDFTRVLQGHIRLASLVFPQGTQGRQMDVLARQALWAAGLNYGHGTGHGVGAYLSVHEGPQSISSASQVALEPGMLTSNEPGLYRTGAYGIRIENLILCVPHLETEFGVFYAFETVSWCPIDRRLILPELLAPAEIAWLDAYHAQVRELLTPHLDAEEAAWLAAQTVPIT